jgi:23S rRNA-/tRNA-specific pseudouridylate synthase
MSATGASKNLMRHVKAKINTSLLPLVANELGITTAEARRMIDMGAVYHLSAYRKSTIPDALPLRATNPATEIQSDEYIRIHVDPKTFPEYHKVDWPARILHQCNDFVVVNKPYNVPSHPTVDNIAENAQRAISELCGDSLKLMHRLDAATSGLLVFTRNRHSTAAFQQAMRDRHVLKTYRAVVATVPRNDSNIAQIPQFRGGQLLINWQEASNRSPKRFYSRPHSLPLFMTAMNSPKDHEELWKIFDSESAMITRPGKVQQDFDTDGALSSSSDRLCLSRIQRVGEAVTKNKRDWMHYAAEKSEAINRTNIDGQRLYEAMTNWCSVVASDDALITLVELELNLLTGRTHQCRGQIQALGSGYHIAGDSLYPGLTADGAGPDSYCLSPYLALQVRIIFKFGFHF